MNGGTAEMAIQYFDSTTGIVCAVYTWLMLLSMKTKLRKPNRGFTGGFCLARGFLQTAFPFTAPHIVCFFHFHWKLDSNVVS